MLGLVPIRAGPRRNHTLISYQAINSLHGLGTIIKHTFKESLIHSQNHIELKTKGTILIRDVIERKEDDGWGERCFDEFIDSLDQIV